MDGTSIESIYPLSPLQQGILFHSAQTREADPYVGQIGITLTGVVDLPAFERAWQTLADRHAVLRTAFTNDRRGRPVQVVMRSARVAVRHLDWRGVGAAEIDARLERLLAQDRRDGFDLARAPLTRIALVQLADERHRLIWTEHHLILDGWSVPLILDDLSILYAAERDGRPADLTPATPYRAYIDWLIRQDRPAAEAYWRRLLEQAEPTVLPMARRVDAAKSGAGRLTEERRIDRARLQRLREVARGLRVTLNTLVQGAWALTLSRYCARRDVVYGLTTSGRPPDLDGVTDIVGPFINTVPVRVRLRPDQPVAEMLRDLQSQQVESQSFGYLPLADIQQSLGGSRQGHGSIEHLFVFENYPERRTASPAPGALAMSEMSAFEQSSFPLALVAGAGDGLVMKALFDADRFDAAGVAALLAHVESVLEQMAARPDGRVADLDVSTAEERRRVLVEWSGTATAYPREASIPDLFEEQARLTPGSIALSCGETTMTYAELERQANQLAHWLRAHGVGPEQVVGVGVERGFRMIVALLAILKAEAAYLPLDPANPRGRLDYTLRESGARAVIADERSASTLDRLEATLISLDRDAGAIAACSPEPPARSHVSARHLAYVMYTSGSTGVPKGVAIEHRSVVRLVRSTGYIRFSSQERFLQFAPLAFDASTLEIWGSLLNGARLELVAAAMPSLDELAGTIAAAGVTTLWLTAGLFHRMVDSHVEHLRGVRQLIAGGEALSPSIVRRAMAALPDTRLVNGYGPTENCTFTTCHTIAAPDADAASVPIGRPIANTSVFILDDCLRPAAPGVPGDLYAAGDGLARAYLNRPDLTADRFIPHPYAGEPGARLYRTGDRARYRADGAIEFLGRADGQVKVRGFRIELDEIEAVLERHPDVRSAAAAIHEVGGGSASDARIVAAVVIRAGSDLSVESLRAFAASHLPAYMLPARIDACDALPLTANGKVDRRAVAERCGEVPDVQSATECRLLSPIEEMLATVWRELFQVPAVSAAADFFALGGHSLLAMQAISRIRDLFPVHLPLSAIFTHPTLEGLAAEIDRLSRADASARVPLARASRPERMPLSLAQQRLWFLDRLEPGNPFYNIHLAFRLRGPLDLGALERSLDDLMRRHEALRTTFPDVAGEPYQRVDAEPGYEWGRFAIGGTEHDEGLQHLVNREAHRPFDLANGPLVRPVLIDVAEDDRVLVLVLHHIIADGRSVGVLLEELSEVYASRVAGRQGALSALAPLQYADYTMWERQWLEGPDVARVTEYWRQRLHGAPRGLTSGSTRPRPVVRSFRGATCSRRIAEPTRIQIEALARREGVTRFMTWLAVLSVLLRHHTGQDDLVIGSDTANRSLAGTERIVGFFVNQIALRLDLSGNPSFRDLLRRIRSVALAAYAHDELPFQKVIDAAAVERRVNQAALFQAKLLYQAGASAGLHLTGVECEPFRVELNSSAFDLVLAMLDAPDGLLATFEFDTDLFDRRAIERLLDDMELACSEALATPDVPIAVLSERLTLAADERRRDERRTRETTNLGLLQAVSAVPLAK